MILLIIVLLLIFGLPGGWYGYNNWGRGPGIGIILLLLVFSYYLLLFIILEFPHIVST